MFKMASQLPAVPFLKGRENYRPWSIKMRAFLKYQELWCTIEVPVDADENPVAIPESEQIKVLLLILLQ